MKLILKDNEGKDLSTEGVDPKVIKLMEAGFASLSGQVGSAISASLKPVETRLDQSLTQINESITKLTPAEGDANKLADKSKPDDADNPVLAAINKLNERLDQVESTTTAEREAKAASQVTQSFVDKHFPNLKGKDIIVARISAAKPKDEDAAKAEFEKIKAEHEAIHGPESVGKVFSASPANEGAKPNEEVDDTEAENQKKLEALNAKSHK